jgi:hypothetical protein
MTPLAISFPQCIVIFFMFKFFKFYLFAMPSLLPATLSEHKLVFFLFSPPPSYTNLKIFPFKIRWQARETTLTTSIQHSGSPRQSR